MNALQPEPHLALIVEDDRDVRDLAAALLEETPLDVVEVENAEAALECLQERGGEVAMLFADVRLPGDDGRGPTRQGRLQALANGQGRAHLRRPWRPVWTICRSASPSCRSRGAASMCWSRPRRPFMTRSRR